MTIYQRPTQRTTSTGMKVTKDVQSGLVLPTEMIITPAFNINDAIQNVSKYGGGTVFLLNGTYLVDYDIEIPSNVSLVGQSGGGAIIDFQSQNYQMVASGSNVYSTGTVSATTNSATVTGIGTAWTTDMIGQTIFLAAVPYVITNVSSATSLTIEAPFEELTFTAGTYAIFDPVSNILVDNLTVQNSIHANGALSFQYIQDSKISNVSAYDSTRGINLLFANGVRCIGFGVVGNGIGIYADNVGGGTYNDFFAYASTGTCNIFMGKMISWSIANFECTTSSGAGIIMNSSYSIGLYDFTMRTNVGIGVSMTTCTDIELFAAAIFSSGSDGVKLVTDNSRIGINLVTLRNNGGYGVNISAASNVKNTVTSSFFTGNTSGTINNLGTTTVSANNQT